MGSLVNDKLKQALFIKHLYFKKHKHYHFSNIVWKLKDKLIDFFVCCIKKSDLTDNQKLYMKGSERMAKELDIIGILQTINKMKASLSVLIKDDKELIKKARHYYVKQ